MKVTRVVENQRVDFESCDAPRPAPPAPPQPQPQPLVKARRHPCPYFGRQFRLTVIGVHGILVDGERVRDLSQSEVDALVEFVDGMVVE